MAEQTFQSSDAHLVDACLDGDEKAWYLLVARYKRLVYSIPLKWGHTQEDAVDIFQAVWLDCFRQLSSVRDVENLQPWLVRVATRKCHRLSQIRRARGEDSLSDDGNEISAFDEPARFLAEVDREQMLRSAMEHLSARCRQVIESLFFEDPRPTYQALAARLGISENSIGFTRERCLNSLRRILADLGYEP